LALSAGDLQEEEDKVKDLAKYLKEKAIANLIARLEQNSCEGMPSDSATLKELLHSNGINMRYLGYLADQVQENKKVAYFRYLLEREVVIRCSKHILNQYIRDNESSELLGAVIAHLLNCLLAPKEFLKRLDDGAVAYEPMTVKKAADEHQEELRLDSKNDSKV
jgi:protein TIF31